MRLPIAASSSLRLAAGDDPAVMRDLLLEASGKRFRRINRFTELALIGVYRCINQLPEPPSPDTALILASESGPVALTVKCLDAIHNDHQPPKPVDFINVSGNMAGYYVAQALGLQGSNLTVCRGADNFAAALELALIELPRAPGVLVGIVEECAWPLSDHRQRFLLADDAPMTEYSDWLYLSHDDALSPQTVDFERGESRDPLFNP